MISVLRIALHFLGIQRKRLSAELVLLAMSTLHPITVFGQKFHPFVKQEIGVSGETNIVAKGRRLVCAHIVTKLANEARLAHHLGKALHLLCMGSNPWL